MVKTLQRDRMSTGINTMFAVLLVPLGDSCSLVHVLDDFPPADARVVGTEGNFTELSCIGNDAHLGSPEVVIEKVLEPHSRNQEEIPSFFSPALDVFLCPVA